MNILCVLQKKIEVKEFNVCDYKNKLVTFLNPYSYLYFRKNIELFREFDIIYIDGISLVLLVKLINRKISRKSFDMSSLAPQVFNKAISDDKFFYFVGSKEEEMIEFLNKIGEIYPKLKIKGFRNGFFSNFHEMNGCWTLDIPVVWCFNGQRKTILAWISQAFNMKFTYR